MPGTALELSKDRGVQSNRRRRRVCLNRTLGLRQPIIRSAFRWKVPSPIGFVFQVFGGGFVFRLAAHQVLQRAEEGRRNGCTEKQLQRRQLRSGGQAA